MLSGACRLLARVAFTLLAFVGACGAPTPPTLDTEFDLVIRNGRVMDPESGLDAIRHVGIRDGSVAYIGVDPISGRTEIDASAQVVAPGFIDLNNHDVRPEYFRMKALDGVTSVLVLESGAVSPDDWYQAHAGKAVVHYGVGVDTGGARMLAADEPDVEVKDGVVQSWPTPELTQRALTEAELAEALGLIDAGLAQGAVAVSMGIEYFPGTTHSEVLELFRQAASHDAFVFAHIRNWDKTRDYDHLYEMIAASAITGAPAHVTHLNSVGADYVDRYLEFIATVRERGIDVTTDGYPYTSGLTGIEATMFDDWESWPDERFDRYQWAANGEWLDRESFGRYRAQGGWVLIHWMKEEWILSVIGNPIAMIASDGAWDDGLGHPRGAGTYSRVLGRYVREEEVVSLMEALRKMTLMPARRLEARVHAMTRKGRLQVGADADITIFDPATILDRATYAEPTLPSAGIHSVMVGGTVVVTHGEPVDGVYPGEPIRGPVGPVAGPNPDVDLED